MRLLVVNPYASGVTEERIAEVTAALGDVEVRRTEHRGHATDLVRGMPDAEAVYVFSGDGGFNEVLNGIGPDTPVGFVPGGRRERAPARPRPSARSCLSPPSSSPKGARAGSRSGA